MKVSISSSGKARPMPSPSTTGKPHCSAVIIGPRALPPPISADDNRVDLLAQLLFQGADGSHDLAPFLQLFIADRRRAHAAYRADQRVIGHVIGANDSNRTAL